MRPAAKVHRGTYHNRHTKTDTGGLKMVAVGMQTAIKTPCAECPLRVDSAPGFLGGYSPEMYIEILHSPASIACHSSKGFHEGDIAKQRHCTGVAAYRANVGHICHIPVPGGIEITAAQNSTNEIGVDRVHYFTSPEEFVAHHKPGQEPKDG